MQYKDPYIELCIEGPSSVFRGLSQNEKELFDQNHTVSVFKKGRLIIQGGTKIKGLFCLVSGKAKISGTGAGNREQIIKMIKPQSLINCRSLFSDAQFPFSVEALEDCATVYFPKNFLTRILKQNAELSLKIMKVIAEDLHHSYERIISLTQKHVRGRLAESILLLRDMYGLDADEITLRVQVSREDLAHLSNMTTSNAIRTLSNLEAEKIIEIERRKIRILDFSKLEEISESGQ
ncbi:MAG: Crp/Fnr family transcriptional regulator [Bacteroidota bacterium]|nr:Crp/Fnr family transcriptional regulator [Bacteroidota bacterium]